jgi:hypothetical protein
MISTDFLCGFLAGLGYAVLALLLTRTLVGSSGTPKPAKDKGYTEHWKLEDQ